MSRQIQIRRGSATEHEDFTGAIGEITMDTTNKTLRVHDGETVGGTPLAKQSDLDTADYVVEYQNPTAENNYSWYRKYKSGWVEQGGKGTGGASKNGAEIQLPITMADSDYNIVASIYGSISNAAPRVVLIVATTTSNFNAATMYAGVGDIAYGSYKFNWFVCGMRQI